MEVVSNSEIETYNLCKMKHHFAYDLEIQAKETGVPNPYLGTVGHIALAALYTEKMAGKGPETCLKAAIDVVEKEISRIAKEEPGRTDKLEAMAYLRGILPVYMEFNWKRDTFRVLAVEKEYTALVSTVEEDLHSGLILDLLVEWIAGPERGNFMIIDHKFKYNFLSDKELAMNGQMPKYIKTIQLATGMLVTKAMFNQVRSRSIKAPAMDQLFRRSLMPTNKKEISQIWSENTDTIREIKLNRAPIRRTLSQLTCKNCDYEPVCKAMLSGQPVDLMIQHNYKRRERPLKNGEKVSGGSGLDGEQSEITVGRS